MASCTRHRNSQNVEWLCEHIRRCFCCDSRSRDHSANHLHCRYSGLPTKDQNRSISQTVSNRTVRRLRNRMDLGRRKGPQAGSPIAGSAALRPWRTTRESAETGPQAISLSTRFIFVRVGPATIHNGKPSREDLFPAALLNLADNLRSESEKITR